MKTIAFVDSNTGQVISDAGVPLYQKPKGSDYPDTGDEEVVLILHVNQRADDNTSRTIEPYCCFETCIETLCQSDSGNPQYGDHKTWVAAHSNNIVGIVLTTGDAINYQRVARSREKLARKRPDIVLGALRIYELESALKTNRLVEFLTGEIHLNLALQALSSLLPFGLIWESSNREGTDRSLPEIASDLRTEDLPAFEGLIANRLKEHLEGKKADVWAVKDQRLWVSVLDRAFKDRVGMVDSLWQINNQSTVPDNLDGALKLLAESKALDEWNSRLEALRECLLKSRLTAKGIRVGSNTLDAS